MPEWIINWLRFASWTDLIVVFTIESLAILVIVVTAERRLIERFGRRRVALPPIR